MSAVNATREPNFLLARQEKRLLRAIAARLPRWILPDDLTALGVAAAIGICIAYLATNDSRAWLWVASGLLVVHWLGSRLAGIGLTVFGVAGLAIAGVMCALLVARAIANLRALRHDEPAASRS